MSCSFSFPIPEELQDLQDACAGDMNMMRHCRQCRADAVGLLGEDRGEEFTLDKIAAMDIDYDSAMKTRAVVHAGIMAGINNDLGSGGSVDLMVINKEGHTPLRNYDRPNQRKSKRDYTFPVGTTTVLSETFTPLSSLVSVTKTTTIPTGAKSMEID